MILHKLMQMSKRATYLPNRFLTLAARILARTSILMALEIMRYALIPAPLKATLISWLNKHPGLKNKCHQFSQKHHLLTKQPLHKRVPKWIALKMMRYVLEHESLKVRLRPWLNNHPELNRKLRQLTRKYDLLPTHSDKANQSVEPHELSDALYNEGISHLTPTARQIYMELKTTLRQRQHEDDTCV